MHLFFVVVFGLRNESTEKREPANKNIFKKKQNNDWPGYKVV